MSSFPLFDQNTEYSNRQYYEPQLNLKSHFPVTRSKSKTGSVRAFYCI